VCASLSVSLSHTHTQTHSLCLSLSLCFSLYVCVLQVSHMHAYLCHTHNTGVPPHLPTPLPPLPLPSYHFPPLHTQTLVQGSVGWFLELDSDCDGFVAPQRLIEAVLMLPCRLTTDSALEFVASIPHTKWENLVSLSELWATLEVCIRVCMDGWVD